MNGPNDDDVGVLPDAPCCELVGELPGSLSDENGRPKGGKPCSPADFDGELLEGSFVGSPGKFPELWSDPSDVNVGDTGLSVFVGDPNLDILDGGPFSFVGELGDGKDGTLVALGLPKGRDVLG